jgi:hypothetical protein
MKTLDLTRLRNCGTNGTCWDVGNNILYDLCKRYPRHDDQREILAKTWIIGRCYAAAIERRKKFIKGYEGDSFHRRIVGPQMLAAGIDEWLKPLDAFKQPSLENAAQIIAVHKKMTHLFFKMSGLEKRSLASKYLHFHFPNLFYLYDSRAAQELSKIARRSKESVHLKDHDTAYASYFLRCLDFLARIKVEHRVTLNPRQLDNYLLGFGD